jgi:hypothetical protein
MTFLNTRSLGTWLVFWIILCKTLARERYHTGSLLDERGSHHDKCYSDSILIRNETLVYWVFGVYPQFCSLKTQKNTKFRKLDLFPSSGERWEKPTLSGALVRANLNHWTTSVSIYEKV